MVKFEYFIDLLLAQQKCLFIFYCHEMYSISKVKTKLDKKSKLIYAVK